MTFYYILMSQKDFLENQVIEEILRERANFYFNQKKTKDFWILIQPTFLNNPELKEKVFKTNFYTQQKKNLENELNNNSFFVSLVSSNKEFIQWISLRLGYFENITNSKTNNENLKIFTSNGVTGILQSGTSNIILENSLTTIHPDILVNKYKQSLKYFYI